MVVFTSPVIKYTKYRLTHFLSSNRMTEKLQKSPKKTQKSTHR